MSDSVFFEIEFVLMVLFSLILPISIYALAMALMVALAAGAAEVPPGFCRIF